MATKTEPGTVAVADTMQVDCGSDLDRTVPAAGPGASERDAASARPSAPNVGSGVAPEGAPKRGDTIGRFVVLGVLGAGGMGLVYSAYDPHLDRKVAIKLLHPGAEFSAAEGSVRLVREAQAMAKINHPNVIAIHEVGTFGAQVYLAMEFADGGTLRAWLGAAKRTQRDILAVFVQAGRGLVAAHAAGLVHRDFKPDNVLITTDGGVRVTDFGIVGVADVARGHRSTSEGEITATARPLSGSTPISQQLTRTGAIMGTPVYMAPEQFQGMVATDRADQFSFCASLYEALYGERAFAGETFEALELAVLSGRIASPPAHADVPGWLRRVLVRGLAAVPTDRYASMQDLLAALARDPAQRIRRIGAVAAGAIVVGGVALLIGLRTDPGAACGAGATRFDTAWNAQRSAAMQAAFAATKRPHAAATFAKVVPLLDDRGRAWRAGFVAACDATHVRHAQSEVLLDRRVQCLDRQRDDTRTTVDLLIAGDADAVDHALEAVVALPTVDACADVAALTAAVAPPETRELRAQVDAVQVKLDEARAQRRLGRFAPALALARDARALAAATGYRPIEAEALLMIGGLEIYQGERTAAVTLGEAMRAAAEAGDEPGMVEAAANLVFQLAKSGKPYEHLLEIATIAEAVGRHARIPAEAQVLLEGAFGAMEEAHGRTAAAQTRYEHALALAEQAADANRQTIVKALSWLGNLARNQGRFADARALLERRLTVQEEVFGKDHPKVADALNDLGLVSSHERKLDDAKALHDRALAIRVAALGPDHPQIGTSYNNLGNFYSAQGAHAKAEELYARALAIWEATYGADGVELTPVLINLGNSYADRRELPRARAWYERAIKVLETRRGPEHPDLGAALSGLGTVAGAEHHLDEALALYQRALAIAEKAYGPDHPDVGDVLTNIAAAYQKQGRLAESEATKARSLAILEKVYGADHPRVGIVVFNIGTLQAIRENYPGAIESFKKSLAILEKGLGKDHPHLSYPLGAMGEVLVLLKRFADAVPVLERDLAIRRAAAMPISAVATSRYFLAQALAGSPRTRRRAAAEAKQAAAEFDKANEPDNAAEVRAWLKAH